MRGGAFPPALLCAALGLGLASAEAKAVLEGFVVLGVTSCATALAPLPATWSRFVFLGCWVSVLACATTVYRARTLKAWGALALALNAGVWTGAMIALGPSKVEVFEALPFSLCAWPAAWARQRGGGIILKVLASWLVAVSVLAATLEFLPVTPGYLPDHVD